VCGSLCHMDISYCSLEEQPDLSRSDVEELNLEGNYLRSLQSERLPLRLKILRCVFNSLGSDGLPSRFPPTLEELHLEKNKIGSLQEVDTFPEGLRVLNVKRNGLHIFPSHLPASLEELQISGFHFHVLNHLPRSLKRLEAENGCLKMIQSRLPPTLERLNLGRNYLKSAALPLFWGHALRELRLGNNCLTEFPKRLPGTLEFLHLQGNLITHIPGSLPPKLRVLMLSFNRIRSVHLEFRSSPLEFVDLRDNCLTQADIWTCARETGWAKNLDMDDNWNFIHHIQAAFRIQKAWRGSRMRHRLRAWKRTKFLKPQLLERAMAPERAGRFESPSPEWPNSECRNHRDHHSG
jgi:Leucine-rich repeat (LRR) protein